jgi:predicted AAA+ superfamily ATPase
MTKIRIERGTYKLRGKETDLNGLEFDMVEPFKVGARGGYVTVDGSSQPGFPERNIKIMCDSADDYTVLDGESDDTQVTAKREETDEEIVARMRHRFEMLDGMTRAAKKGEIRAMIVSGPPGVGKSFGVEQVLGKHDLITDLDPSRKAKYQVVKGAMSALGLYCKLYEFADKDNVIVFDDCDSILLDDLALNLLKAALDSKKVRRIHWNTDSSKLANEGIPNSFEFKGSAIFITNLKFENVKSKKLKDHLEALESRCHYVDLTIDSERDKMLRIKQIVEDGMLKDYGFKQETIDEIMDYVDTNKSRFRELSLRTIVKLADLVKAFPNTWQEMAGVTLLRK